MTADPFFAAAVFPHTAARPDTGPGCPTAPDPVSDHQRLTAGTADLWRQLVHLCWETPCDCR